MIIHSAIRCISTYPGRIFSGPFGFYSLERTKQNKKEREREKRKQNLTVQLDEKGLLTLHYLEAHGTCVVVHWLETRSPPSPPPRFFSFPCVRQFVSSLFYFLSFFSVCWTRRWRTRKIVNLREAPLSLSLSLSLSLFWSNNAVFFYDFGLYDTIAGSLRIGYGRWKNAASSPKMSESEIFSRAEQRTLQTLLHFYENVSYNR